MGKPCNSRTKLLIKTELVSRSLKAKTPAELRKLGGRIRQILDKQDGNKPEYVKE